MVHFSNHKTMLAMLFYAVLTFVVGPFVVRWLKKDTSKDPRSCVPGFLLGFTISVLLWMKYGRKYAKK